MQKMILVYGDSNTWGFIPQVSDEAVRERYDGNVRWTGVMQKELGESFYVIENGLCGRCTCRDDFFIGPELNWNGADNFPAVFDAVQPLDLLIIMLGTNDLRSRINLSPQESAQGIERIINLTYKYANPRVPKILIVAPVPLCKGQNPGVNLRYGDNFNVSYKLAEAYELLAKKHSLAFFDTAKVVPCADGCDGIHLSSEAHSKIGYALAEEVKVLFS